MAKKNDKPEHQDPLGRIRKIGEREEIIKHTLGPAEVAAVNEEILVLLDEAERIEERKAEVNKNFGSQLKTNELQINELRRQSRNKSREETVFVEEHLTRSNEVVRIRKDTGDIIGKRTATPRELQEDLPFEQSDSVPQKDAATQADPFSDADAAFAGETH